MIIRILLILFIFNFYVWLATEGTYNFKLFEKEHGSYISYQHLTDAFINGKLHLLIEPKKELLELPDPYNIYTNGQFKWHDASLYNGKYYFYWGITPAILLYIPYYLLTGFYLPDNIVVLFFMFGGFVWSFLLLLHLRNLYFLKIPEWLLMITIAILGFANLGGFIVQKTGVYQVATSCGYFFGVGAVYFLIRSIESKEPNLVKLFMGSLFLGLAVGGRPQYILSGILLFIILKKIYSNTQKRFSLTDTFIFTSLIPFIACLLILFSYNHLRFEDPFEFGTKYQLGVQPYTQIPYFSLDRFPTNIHFLLFHKSIINSIFPFVHFDETFPPGLTWPRYHYFEKTAGVLPITPILLFLLLIPIVYKPKEDTKFPYFEFRLILIPGCINLLILSVAPFATFRHQADYISFFILAVCILWFYLESSEKLSVDVKKLSRIVGVLFALASIWCGIAFGIEGADDNLHQVNPSEYNKIKAYFIFVSDFLQKQGL